MTRNEADHQAARELYLCAESNWPELYRQRTLPVIANLCRKIAAGTYNTTRAVQAFEYVAEDAAKRYAKDFGGVWSQLFPPATRTVAAALLRDAFEAEYEANQYDGVNPVDAAKRKTLPR